jgi:hypothetical protein
MKREIEDRFAGLESRLSKLEPAAAGKPDKPEPEGICQSTPDLPLLDAQIHIPHYSTNPDLALWTLERYCRKNELFKVKIYFNYTNIESWTVEFLRIEGINPQEIHVSDESLSKAICRAIITHAKERKI